MKARKNVRLFVIFSLIVAITIPGFAAHNNKHLPVKSWCDQPLRPGLKQFKEIKTNRPWFKVYDVGNHTYAIDEPYNWEETISYLILGKNKALLFDTGMRLDSISLVVRQLTKLPVVVLNSHTHPDHIGGNSEFSHILAMQTNYTHRNAQNGYLHNQVKWEVSPASVCLRCLPNPDTAHYFIKPFKVSRYIKNGYMIDLGGRKLQVIATPGHTPDAICLYDLQAGYLWCGDSFYEGPILLSDQVTNLKAYQNSMAVIAKFARLSKCVLPAHNLPGADPALVIKAAQDFNQIISGVKKGKPGADQTLVFDCGRFSYQIGEKFLASK